MRNGIELTKARLPLAIAASAMMALGVAACGGDDEGGATATSEGSAAKSEQTLSGTIAGAGASSQAAAMEAWVAGFQQANEKVTVSYDPIGSGGGREQFVAGGTLFGGTDAAFEGDELKAAQKRCGAPGDLIEAPVYVSPIAIVYNLDGVEDLKLSPETLARIFKHDITRWNDPAIAAENKGADLPDERITTVNRSDESGTTENLQEYLSAVVGDVWDFEVSGDWPVKGGEAAQGTSGVIDAVTSGTGTIGYADASQTGDLGVAQIKVGDEYVGPTPEAAAKILDASEESDDPGRFVFTYDLDRETEESGTYPIVLVSYLMACTQYDSAQDAELVKGFLGYIVSPEGQQAASEAAGSAPITDALREKIQPAIDAIGANS